ncbi:MAG: radical SAM protein, partial [Desulfobacterales bacterium]|nr:radical SAM protein [Desulfobacterales bacterium]
MKVLLISANRLREPYPVYPVGLDYVAGALAGAHEVEAVDLNTLAGNGELVELLTTFAPEVTGISLRNIDNTDTTDPRGFMGEYVDLIEILRKHSNTRLVLGGSGFTIFPEQILDSLNADYGIIGEGERLALLLEALEKGRDPGQVPGVISPRKTKRVSTPWQQPFTRPAVTNQPYLAYYLKNGGMLNLQTKRGCPFRCVYCTYPAIEGRQMRHIPPADIARTAISLEKAGARYLFITDSSFNADMQHSREVAQAFKSAGLSIPWGAFFTPLKPPSGYYRELAAAGLTHVEFGTDALSNPVLTAYGKPFTADQVFEAHHQA